MSDACPQCGEIKFAPNDTEWIKNNRRTCYNCGCELITKPPAKKQRAPKHLRGRSGQPEQPKPPEPESRTCDTCGTKTPRPYCYHCGSPVRPGVPPVTPVQLNATTRSNIDGAITWNDVATAAGLLSLPAWIVCLISFFTQSWILCTWSMTIGVILSITALSRPAGSSGGGSNQGKRKDPYYKDFANKKAFYDQIEKNLDDIF